MKPRELDDHFLIFRNISGEKYILNVAEEKYLSKDTVISNFLVYYRANWN